MYFTDGEIIIEEKNNLEELILVKARIERWFEIERGLVFELQFDTTKDFPALLLPDGIKYQDLYDCLVPKLQMKSINNDILRMPNTQFVEVKHIFSEEEVNEMAIKLSQEIISVNKLKIEKATIMKKFAAEVSEKEEKIANEANILAQGYEVKDKECYLVHNFKDKKVYFMSKKEEGVMIKSRDMEKQDFQLQLFVLPLQGDWKEDVDEKPFEEINDTEILRDEKSFEESAEIYNESNEESNWIKPF